MKRAMILATLVLVLMLVLAPVALAQSPSPSPTPLPGSGGPPIGSSIALPAAALLIGSGILTYAILRRR
jgi:hypothetical protein